MFVQPYPHSRKGSMAHIGDEGLMLQTTDNRWRYTVEMRPRALSRLNCHSRTQSVQVHSTLHNHTYTRSLQAPAPKNVLRHFAVQGHGTTKSANSLHLLRRGPGNRSQQPGFGFHCCLLPHSSPVIASESSHLPSAAVPLLPSRDPRRRIWNIQVAQHLWITTPTSVCSHSTHRSGYQ